MAEVDYINQWKRAVTPLDTARKFLNVNAQNLAAEIAALEAAYLGDDVPDLEGAVASIRTSAAWPTAKGSQLVLPALRSWARFVSTEVPKLDAGAVFDALYARMLASGDRVASRQFTRGSPAFTAGEAPTPGNGSLYRLNVDDYGYSIETSTPEVKTFRCTRDQNTGAQRHEEEFSVKGAVPSKDDVLARAGSGIDQKLSALSARNSLIGNASFSSFGGTAGSGTLSGTVTSAVANWVLDAVANFDVDQAAANVYRGFPGDTTPTALIFRQNATIYQLLSTRSVNLLSGANNSGSGPSLTGPPIICQVAYNRQIGGSDGTLTLTLGSQSVSVVLAAQAGYNLLKLPLDANLFYRNFVANPDLKLQLALSGATTKNLRVDDVIFAPMSKIDGTWWALVGGSNPFMKNDRFAVTDTAIGSVLQYWNAILFNRYLPHATGGGITIADPTT